MFMALMTFFRTGTPGMWRVSGWRNRNGRGGNCRRSGRAFSPRPSALVGCGASFFEGQVMVKLTVRDLPENGVVLLFHDLLNPGLKLRAAQGRGVVSFPRSEELSRFIDERLDATKARAYILGLDVEDGGQSLDFGVESGHSPPIILVRTRISSRRADESIPEPLPSLALTRKGQMV